MSKPDVPKEIKKLFDEPTPERERDVYKPKKFITAKSYVMYFPEAEQNYFSLICYRSTAEAMALCEDAKRVLENDDYRVVSEEEARKIVDEANQDEHDNWVHGWPAREEEIEQPD